MGSERTDLWGALVSAERSVARLRADLGATGSREVIIDRALAQESSAWDQLAALNYLKAFNREVVPHALKLFHLALSERWEGLAREVLKAGPREEVAPVVTQRALASLPSPYPEDYLRIASLLSSLDEIDTLVQVAVNALASEDPEIVEAGQFIRERYVPVGYPDSGLGSASG